MKHKRYKAKCNEKGDLIINDSGIEDLSFEEVVDKLNELEETRLRKGNEIMRLREINRLCFEVIDGFKAYAKLKDMGLIVDE